MVPKEYSTYEEGMMLATNPPAPAPNPIPPMDDERFRGQRPPKNR